MSRRRCGDSSRMSIDPFGIRFWPGFKGRDGCRTPMPWEVGADNAGFSTARPWLPVPEEHRGRSVDVQNSRGDSVLAVYRAMLALRRRHPVLATGSIRFLDADGDVLAFVREGEGEALLCVFNFAQEGTVWPLPGELEIAEAFDFSSADAAYADSNVSLPPLGAFLAVLGD